jgi:hypothetical protein
MKDQHKSKATTAKREYNKPALIRYGSIQSVTKAGTSMMAEGGKMTGANMRA